MTVSVIVPVYNVASYLPEALDSIVNQTYKDLEIIIVDDGSTDDSACICEKYASSDSRIKVIHQDNRGLSGARNTGLAHATGDLVSFIDSDDSLSPMFIESLVNAMESSSAPIAVCRFAVIETSGRLSGVAASSVFPNVAAGVYERTDAIKDLVEEKMCVNVCNKLFRRELWSDIRFPDGHVYEDAVAEFKLFDKAERVVVLDEALYNYRRRPDSITASVSMKKIDDCLLAHNTVSEFIRNNWSSFIPDSLYQKKNQGIVSFLILFYIKQIKSGAGDKALEKKLRELIINTKREVGMNTLAPKAKLYYCVIRICPALIKILK